MLVLALAATLVGFVLLVAALLSGVLWLAIACVVVCVIGVGFLVGDLLGLGRRSSAPPESDDAVSDAVTSESDDGDERTPQHDVNDEAGTSDQAQAGDWSATAEHEEDPAAGDRSEDSDDENRGHPPVSEADTQQIPRVRGHGRPDDPPTEEMFLDKPR